MSNTIYKRLELHNHTTESDSALSCPELADYMEADGADAFALTDHNTISGHAKMRELLSRGRYHTECIYGMEYTTYYGHILCLNLTEYVPWDSINLHRPELLFEAVRAKGAIAGIAHPFSYGYPFARGCRFEMTVHDYSAVDFIEVFNNPEPLHEVNEKGLHLWEELVLDGHPLAATCGMDLHGKWKLAGEYATYIEGEAGGCAAIELEKAVRSGRTWVSKGPLLICAADEKRRLIRFTVTDTGKPGFSLSPSGVCLLTLRTKSSVLEKEISPGAALEIALEELPEERPLTIIPRLYVRDTTLENLVCLAPVLKLGHS